MNINYYSSLELVHMPQASCYSPANRETCLEWLETAKQNQ